tara:strand:+ start:369 stop:1448 length:1080 start_codon:yes stop_codon:yes gene_type:complete
MGPKSEVKALGKDYTPIQEEVASQTANKIPFLAFGTVTQCLDLEHAGRLVVDSPAFAHGPMSCDYVSPVGGGGYGLFALPGIGATVLVGSVPFNDPPTKYFWMGCLYAAGQEQSDTVRTQPYYVGDLDPNGRQLPRTEVKTDGLGPTTDLVQSTYGVPDAGSIYGTNDLPDSYIFKHPCGHVISMSDKRADVLINEIKLKTAENKRIILSDAPPAAGGECIQLVDENENSIRITSQGDGKDIGDNSIIAESGQDIDLITKEGQLGLTVTDKSKKNIEISNAGTGDITLDALQGKIRIEADTSITLAVGGSTITITKTGIDISANIINVKGNAGDVLVATKSLVGHHHIGNKGVPTTTPI